MKELIGLQWCLTNKMSLWNASGIIYGLHDTFTQLENKLINVPIHDDKDNIVSGLSFDTGTRETAASLNNQLGEAYASQIWRRNQVIML